MNRTRFEKLRRRAIKAGLRTSRRLHHPLSREEVLNLRVQIVPTAVRILMALAGAALLAASYFQWPSQVAEYVYGIQAAVGIVLTIFGIFGIRRTLSNLVDHLSYEAAELIIKGIFEAILSADP